MISFDNFKEKCPWRHNEAKEGDEEKFVCMGLTTALKGMEPFLFVAFANCTEENCAPLYWVNVRR